jgi:hypothetical protein
MSLEMEPVSDSTTTLLICDGSSSGDAPAVSAKRCYCTHRSANSPRQALCTIVIQEKIRRCGAAACSGGAGGDLEAPQHVAEPEDSATASTGRTGGA